MKKFDVTALGELLIDFTDNGKSAQGNTLFEANPGGAPCNVLAMLNKCGHPTAFVGKVGKDIFGLKLKATLEEVGINTSNLIVDENARTTLAFVQTFEDGDRDFSFFRNPGADMMLTADEVNEELIRESRIFHFGTLSMTHDGVREATKRAIAVAKESGAVISFDPNLRPPLWKSLEDARVQVAYGLGQCDVLKISDNEIQWFTGEEDFDAGIARLREQYQIPLILLSMGRDGSRAYYKDLKVDAAPFLQESTIETTGAGDTFGGSCLHYILKYGLDKLDEEKLKEMEKRRSETRRARQKNNVPVVALVGYTNVGKSSLLNALCGEQIFEADMLFATLDPTARKLVLPSGLQIILVDTVGFVSRLPHHLVEAFKSTLEEAAFADVIIKVADAGDEQAAEQLAVTDEVLGSLDCESIPQLVVYNKCDMANAVAFDPDILLTSAKTGYGLPGLLAKLDDVLGHRVRTIELILPYDKLALADILRSRGSVAAEEYREDGVFYRATVKIDDLHRFEAFLV